MKLVRFFLFTSLFLTGSFVDAGLVDAVRSLFETPKPASPTIKVLLVDEQPSAWIEAKGKYKVYDPNFASLICTRSSGKKRLAEPMVEGLKWGEEFAGIHQIEIVPQESSSTLVVNGIEYRGKIFVYDVDGKISIVNEVDVEEYLRSVLAIRFRGVFSEEALAAFAIAGRTDAYSLSYPSSSSFWHVAADEVDYRGYAVTDQNSSLAQAISLTHCMVLSRDDDELHPFPSFWPGPEWESFRKGVVSRISIEQVEGFAQSGENAKEILAKAFPQTTLVVATPE